MDSVEEDGSEIETDRGSRTRKRDRSLIGFPYTDMERAVDMSATLLREGGQAAIDLTQLAVAMDQSATGGTFRSSVGAARQFGFIETEQGKIRLTNLGLRVNDEESAAAAKAEAFLNVELFRAMFERYQGYALPPTSALERQIESLGVPPKQKERARQTFSSSAQFAGFIASNGRFSKPTLAARVKEDDLGVGAASGNNGGSGNDGRSGGGESDVSMGSGAPKLPSMHPFVEGLLRTLPPPQSEWSIRDRANWLKTAASIFTLIYKGDGTIDVSVAGNDV